MSVALRESKKKIPETVEFYNKTKCGVYVADQMARQYLVKADTCRWPVAVSTTFWIWQTSMHLCSIKNEQVTRLQDEVSCSSLQQNYVKTTSLKDRAGMLLLLDLTH